MAGAESGPSGAEALTKQARCSLPGPSTTHCWGAGLTPWSETFSGCCLLLSDWDLLTAKEPESLQSEHRCLCPGPATLGCTGLGAEGWRLPAAELCL